MNNKPYISPSQLGMYEKCAESYRRRYIERDIKPPGIALVRGTGVHSGAKVNFKQKIESHEDMKKKDIVDISVTEFEKRIEKDGISLTEDEQSEGKGKVIGKTKDSVVSLTELYADETAPLYQPVQVEEKQRVILPGDYDLICIMDLADDKDNVVDLKTTGRKKNEKEVEQSEQLSFYALVFKALNKRLPHSVILEILIDKAEAERQFLEGKRSDVDLQILIRRINTMIKGIEAGIFMPCDQGSWKCSKAYCGYYNSCKYVKGS